MSTFTDAQIAQLSTGTVRVATLTEFLFVTPLRYWNGDRQLSAGGKTWEGLGGLATIDGLTEIRTGEATQVRFTLTGTNADVNTRSMAVSVDQTGDVAAVYFQLFDADWATVGNPIFIWSGLTQPMNATVAPGEEGDGPQRSITLPCESLFFGRARPGAGLYTQSDQLSRFPGDLFFQYQHLLRSLTYVWP